MKPIHLDCFPKTYGKIQIFRRQNDDYNHHCDAMILTNNPKSAEILCAEFYPQSLQNNYYVGSGGNYQNIKLSGQVDVVIKNDQKPYVRYLMEFLD